MKNSPSREQAHAIYTPVETVVFKGIYYFFIICISIKLQWNCVLNIICFSLLITLSKTAFSYTFRIVFE